MILRVTLKMRILDLKPKLHVNIDHINNPRVTGGNMVTIATFDDVKNLRQNTFVIDVREPNELQQTGTIPNSINIPLGQLETVILQMDNKQFHQTYGRDKPTPNDRLIFSCKSGQRALTAANSIIAHGFKNVQYYKGSWLEWVEKMKK